MFMSFASFDIKGVFHANYLSMFVAPNKEYTHSSLICLEQRDPKPCTIMHTTSNIVLKVWCVLFYINKLAQWGITAY